MSTRAYATGYQSATATASAGHRNQRYADPNAAGGIGGGSTSPPFPSSVSPPPRMPTGHATPFSCVEKVPTANRSQSSQYRPASATPSDGYGPSPSVATTTTPSSSASHFGAAAAQYRAMSSRARGASSPEQQLPQQWHPYAHPYQQQQQHLQTEQQRTSSHSSPQQQHLYPSYHHNAGGGSGNGYHPHAHGGGAAPMVRRSSSSAANQRLSPPTAAAPQNNNNIHVNYPPTPQQQHHHHVTTALHFQQHQHPHHHNHHPTAVPGTKTISPAASTATTVPSHNLHPYHVKVNFTDNCRVLVHDLDPTLQQTTARGGHHNNNGIRHTYNNNNSNNGIRHTYVCGKFLGQGAFAKVFQFTDIATGKEFAAKIVEKSKVVDKKKHTKLMQEIEIHRCLNHSHILRFYDHFQDESYHYILLEMCTCKTLMEVSRKHGAFNVPEVQYIMAQLLSACHHMHENHVIHRDLKLGNVMIDGDLQMKVGDFGLAAKLEFDGERKRTMCGTPNYIAPEILADSDGYGIEVDIWSLGVILYTLLVGIPPFETADLKTTYSRIKRGEYSFPPNIKLPLEGKALIHKILQCRPERRPSIVEIRNDMFFRLPTSVPRSVPLSFTERVMVLCETNHSLRQKHHHQQQQQQQQRSTSPPFSSPQQQPQGPESDQQPQQQHDAPSPAPNTAVPLPQHRRDPTTTNRIDSASPPARAPPAPPLSLPLPPPSRSALSSAQQAKTSPQIPAAPHPYENLSANNRSDNGLGGGDAKNQATDCGGTPPQPLEQREVNRPQQLRNSGTGDNINNNDNNNTAPTTTRAARSMVSPAMNSPQQQQQQQQHCCVEMSATSDTHAAQQQQQPTQKKTQGENANVVPTSPPRTTIVCDTASQFWDSRFVMQRTYQSGSNNVPLKQQPCVWITRYIDLSKKYGFGYYLSTGQLGVYFNDRTKIVWDPSSNCVDYYARTKVEGKLKDVLETFTLTEHPAELDKKVTLTRYFKSYFMKDGSTSSSNNNNNTEKSGADVVPHQKVTVGSVIHCCPPVVSPRPFPVARATGNAYHTPFSHHQGASSSSSSPVANAPCYAKEFTMLREFTVKAVSFPFRSASPAAGCETESKQLFDAQMAAPNALVVRLSNGQYQFSYPPVVVISSPTTTTTTTTSSSLHSSTGIAALQQWCSNVDFFVGGDLTSNNNGTATTTASGMDDVMTLCHHVTGKRLSMTKKDLCFHAEQQATRSNSNSSSTTVKSLFALPLTTLALDLEGKFFSSADGEDTENHHVTSSPRIPQQQQQQQQQQHAHVVEADDMVKLFVLHAKIAALCLRPVRLSDVF